MLYSCYKNQLVALFRRIIQHTLHCENPSYEDTMRLDSKLRETHTAAPPSLRMKPLSLMVTDQAPTILNRLYIDLLYLTSFCVLHRRYLTQERSNPAFDYPRKSCMDAALRVLGHQVQLHAACQPGGQFDGSYLLLSSLTLHDFLVAAMVTCVDLYESRNNPPTTAPDLKAQDQKIDALVRSHQIWESRQSVSRDARHACKVLAFILSKVPRPSIDSSPADFIQQRLAVTEADSTRSSWPSNGSEGPNQDCRRSDDHFSNPKSIDPLSKMFSGMEDLDWVSVDTSPHLSPH